MRIIRSHLALSLLAFATMFAPVAVGEEFVAWEDYTTPMIAPVGRAVDFLRIRGNGFVCSETFTQYIEHNEATDGQSFAGNWVVTPRQDGNEGWASLRVVMPEEFRGKTAGISLELVADEPMNLDIWALKGAGNFWSYNSLKLNSRACPIPAGRSRIVVRWKDLEVSPSEVGAFAINRSTTGTLGIARMDLVVHDDQGALDWKRARQKEQMMLRLSMLEWLGRLGVDLRSLQARLGGNQVERLAWLGVHLLAQGHQIENIGSLAKANKVDAFDADALEQQRSELLQMLLSGEDVSHQVNELQQRLDAQVDEVLKTVPIERRKWSVKNDRFVCPTGRPFRMFAPHFFRAIYEPWTRLTWRQWDLRYLAGMGFNGLRLPVVWKRLEPHQGRFDEEYLAMLRDICISAERLGLAVSFDLHWPYPDWFRMGMPGKTISKPPQHGPYQWPDALVDTWERIGSAFADIPNIIAWEVPTNEPSIASFVGGLTRYPSDLEAWNMFLKNRYLTLDQLDATWSAAGEEYGLGDDEDWDDNSIMPLGFKPAGEDVQVAYAHNPRIWDHILFCADRQHEVTGRIIEAIRKSVPNAVGMMQHTMGDTWDRSPIPIDYHSIQTVIGTNVLPGTHYGVGNIQSHKAASLTLASYDSEHQMENNLIGVQRHVDRGLGFCPFAFHARGGGGMLFANDTWMLKPSVTHLPIRSTWIREYWPQKSRPTVAVIINTRLEATTGRRVDGIISILQNALGLDVDVFEGLRVVREPTLLSPYSLVITTSSWMDRDLLGVLDKKFSGFVLLFGRLDVDAYASPRLGEELSQREILVANPDPMPMDNQATGRIDLVGTWEWLWAGRSNKEPPHRVETPRGNWQTMNVPAKWGELEIQGSLKYRLGDAWYLKRIEIPAQWEGRELGLNIGAIDDYDWTYFNGVCIGRTTNEDRADHWLAARSYTIPTELVRFGEVNDILICVRNTNIDGGIYKTPVELVSSTTARIRWCSDEGEYSSIRLGRSPTFLIASDLHPRAQVLAELDIGTESAGVGMARHGRWMWFPAARPQGDSTADVQAIKTACSIAGICQ